MSHLKRWIRMYGLKNVVLRGIYTKSPILPVEKNELLRRMNWQFRVKRKITPYLRIKEADVSLAENNPYPNTIWWLWFQGIENAPSIVKKCFNSVRRYASSMGFQVIQLNDRNLLQYVNIPDFVVDKWKSGKIGNANFSDICRVSLLAQYGGLWLDSTVMLTGEIDSNILKLPLFFYKASFLDLSVTKISNWFMYAKSAGNAFLLSVRDSMIAYWEKNNFIDDYYVFHLCVAALSEKQNLSREFEEIPFYSNTYPQLLGMELTKKYDAERIAHITCLSNVHKLTYKGLENLSENTVYGHLIDDKL